LVSDRSYPKTDGLRPHHCISGLGRGGMRSTECDCSLFVCLLATSCKNYQPNRHETFTTAVSSDKEVTRFCVRI